VGQATCTDERVMEACDCCWLRRDDVYMSEPVDVGRRVESWKVERPSRVWDVADGAVWWTTVDLFAGHGMDGIVSALRPSLEAMRIGVALWSLANDRNVRRVFAGEDSHAPYVIVAMHGDAGRMLLTPGAGAPDSKSSFSVDEVRSMVRVPGKVVLGIGCASGTQEWADAFFEGGATDYVAPISAPFAHAASVFTTILFYGLTQGRDLAEAVATARAVDDELAIFRHFRS
jgi:hypothetical protein